MFASRWVGIGSLGLLALVLTISAVAQSAAPQSDDSGATATEDGVTAAPQGETSFSLIRGSDLPVRNVGAAEFDESSKLVAVETFRDEDLGSVVYLTSEGALGVVSAPPNYTTKIAPYGDSFSMIRYMPRMGTCWLMELGEWRLIEETDADLFMGDYHFELLASGPASEEIDIVRIEQLTGATWIMSDYRWVAIEEPVVESDDEKTEDE